MVSNGQDMYEVFQDVSLMDERDLSRNAMSSRAVPVQKMIDQVRNDPAMPIHWGANKPGMQAGEELTGGELKDAKAEWLQAAKQAADSAEQMMRLGLHKQVVNRILEPFQWMRTIVTSTEWDNFFDLRLHEMAEPNMQALAKCMREALDNSTPIVRDHHLPYFDDVEYIQIGGSVEKACLISAARCARVSYLNHDGSAPSVTKDLELATMLKNSRHASPFEHVAFSAGADTRSRNFVGWNQFRETLGL